MYDAVDDVPALVHRLTLMTQDRWYFAYGSNMSIDQKQYRAGSIREQRCCRLPGYRFAFNKTASDGTAFANIMDDPVGMVWGVCYLCDEEAFDILDGYEGVNSGDYQRHNVIVVTDAGDELEAITYVACKTRVMAETSPRDDYLQSVLTGAQEHGLPPDYIAHIRNCAEWPTH